LVSWLCSDLVGWSAVENSKSALENARNEAPVRLALAQWSAVHSAWASVETALQAATALAALQNASTTQQGRDATSNLLTALDAAQKQLDSLATLETAPASEVPPPSFQLEKLSETAAIMKKQVQALTEWSQRNEELAAVVAAAQRCAPRISSFAAAQAEAAAALQDASMNAELAAALKSSRLATSVLSKLSGVAVLRREVESYAGGSATRLTVCVRGQSAVGIVADEDMYSSEEAFAKVFAAQESAAAEPDCLLLSLLVLTPSQIAEAAAVSGASMPAVVATVDELDGAVLLSGHTLGALPSAALAQMQQQAQQSRGDSIAATLERTVKPCGHGVNTAVTRSIERAMEAQALYKVRGVEALLRDVAFDIAQH
jgi:hypothetical protein